jgi:excisionase family DNA binding protein
MIQQQKPLLTAREVAARIGIGLRTVWRWTETGTLPAPVRWGRRTVRWRAADIERFIYGSPRPPEPKA